MQKVNVTNKMTNDHNYATDDDDAYDGDDNDDDDELELQCLSWRISSISVMADPIETDDFKTQSHGEDIEEEKETEKLLLILRGRLFINTSINFFVKLIEIRVSQIVTRN